MRLRVLSIAVTVIAGLAMPAIAFADELTPAMRAWMKAVSHRLESEGFSVRSSRIDSQGLTFEATFRRRGEMQPAPVVGNERSPAENR